MVNIIVIGAGMVGLSTAVNIQRVLPGVKVKVVADRFYDETTIIGAGGIFIPATATVPGVPVETLKRWCEKSWSVYSKWATSELASITGHTVSHGYVFVKTEEETPLYASTVYSCRKMLPSELTRLGVDRKIRFTDNGGKVEKRKIESFGELHGQCDIVVNCSGLGSRQLCGDKFMYPLYGQVVRVEAPWVKYWVHTDTMAHILPSVDFTLNGGIKDKDNYSMTPDPSVKQRILDRCRDLWPALKGARMVGDWVGLRPVRDPIRLEKEIVRLPEGILKVVHNYGHGSNGVALSWGTAVEATEMVKELMSGMTPSKL